MDRIWEVKLKNCYIAIFFNALLLNTARSDRRAYTFYTTDQLTTAARIKSYRQLDLSIEEIKAIFKGKNARKILEEKAKALVNQQKEIDVRLSIINHILEKDSMKYQVTIKEIPEMTVYYWEKRLEKYSDMMQVIPEIGEEVRKRLQNCRTFQRMLH